MIAARPEVELQKYSRELGSYHEKMSRDGHQMRHHQFQRWRAHRMLQKGASMKPRQVELEHQTLRWTRRRHASDFSPGSVTFVVRSRIQSMNVSIQLHAGNSTVQVIEHDPMSDFSAGRLISFSEAFIN